jgi:hypothetical protein
MRGSITPLRPQRAYIASLSMYRFSEAVYWLFKFMVDDVFYKYHLSLNDNGYIAFVEFVKVTILARIIKEVGGEF